LDGKEGRRREKEGGGKREMRRGVGVGVGVGGGVGGRRRLREPSIGDVVGCLPCLPAN